MAKKRSEILFEERKESLIECPNCEHGVKLIVRTNRQRGDQFLGCPNFPECTYTQEIPEAWYLEAMGQPKLF